MEFPKKWTGREVSRRELLNFLGMVGAAGRSLGLATLKSSYSPLAETR